MHRSDYWLGSDGAGAIERGDVILDPLLPTWDPEGLFPLDITGYPTVQAAERSVYALLATPEAIWIGTDEGLGSRGRRGAWEYYTPSADGLIGAPVRALAAHEGHIWIGTDNGLCVLEPHAKRWRRFRAEDSGLPDDRVTALACDGENIWGGTASGGFRIDRAGRWKQTLIDEPIHDIALSSARQYVATDRGVFALDREGRVRRQLEKKTSITKVFVDGPELWAAMGEGIRRILFDQAEGRPPWEGRPSRRGPEGVLVIINEDSEDSVTVGEAYAALRKIPPENVVRIRCPTDETISRRTYFDQIKNPIRTALLDRNLSRQISFIVTTRGVPLRIAPDRRHAPRRARLPRPEASVDSELTLLARWHPLDGPIRNPYLHRDDFFDSTRFGCYLVTRLDGPSAETVLAIAKRSFSVEAQRTYGSRGYVRFDLFPGETEMAELYNEAILANYDLARHQSRLSGRIGKPERTELPYYEKGACYNTFFYLGWGVRRYDPEVFSWMPASVGVCLDAATATTLHDPDASWVAGALDEELAATIGMVYDAGPEPYLSVAELYRNLMTGYTWAEAAYMSLPHLSWQGVVLGDPLYKPF
jgi:uncharacterized protein (TIGR03790 family)